MAAPGGLPGPLKEAVAGPRAEAARGLVVGLDLRSLENALGSQELRVEAALLFRVIYKNRNQHRRTGYLRNLERCARHLTRLSRLQLPAVLADLRDAAGAQGACPSSDACALALRRLLAGAHTCTAAIQDAESAALDVSGHLSMGFFLPLGVVVLSICARLRALLSARTAAIADAYNALARVLESLPPSSTRTHARHEPRAVPTPWLACTGADARPPRVAPLPRTFLVAWPSGVPRAVACGTVGATRIPEVDDSAGRGAKEAAASSAGEEPPDAETARGMDAELVMIEDLGDTEEGDASRVVQAAPPSLLALGDEGFAVHGLLTAGPRDGAGAGPARKKRRREETGQGAVRGRQARRGSLRDRVASLGKR